APQRLHALDNLRALMIWLGIVLHVALNHLTVASPLPWRDPQTSRVTDLLLLFIHGFRMPVFFVLAGFFVALLIERRGAGGM
ncbi:acyltransferase, partial [Xylella fastidiosa subsp. multiplex]|uniref:acyltransferase family protein n=1 Tax=Xylella fastidiosa TaxID=2371 RepID=UPI0012AE0E85